MEKTVKNRILGIIRLVFYPAGYPFSIIWHAIIGLFVAAAAGYRGEGVVQPLVYMGATVVLLFLVYLLLIKWKQKS